MTSEFSTWYLALLRKQVDEEIQFLVTNGHDTRKIHVTCPFCIDTRKGYHTCYRLNQLREFQSGIVSNQANFGRKPVERKQLSHDEVIQTLDNSTLPPMFPALKPIC